MGIDRNLAVSLNEYGLIWGENDADGCYQFIYMITDDAFMNASVFYGTDVFEEYDFIDDEFFNFIGMDKEDWLGLTIPQQFYDLIGFYGVESIFGSVYDPACLFSKQELEKKYELNLDN